MPFSSLFRAIKNIIRILKIYFYPMSNKLRVVRDNVVFAQSLDEIGKDIIKKIYINLLTARFFENKAILLFTQGKIKKWCLSGIGQEAGPTVISTLLHADDWIIPPYRGYAHVISKGLPLESLAAELLGKTAGPVGGRGNPGNYISPEIGIFANSDILGNNFPTAVGMAYAKKYLKDTGIIVSYFGDGTATRSVLYGSLNLSVIWNLPILWVCENNQYSVSTKVSQMTKTSFAAKAKGFGLRSEEVDGNDITLIIPKVHKLIEYVRNTKKPAFLELLTYRVASHDLVVATSNWYQNPAEQERWRNRDPLLMAKSKLLSLHIFSKPELEELQKTAKQEVDESFRKASKLQNVTKEKLLNQVYE